MLFDEMIPHDVRAEQLGWDGCRFQASLLDSLRHLRSPLKEFLVGVVRTANQTDRRVFRTPFLLSREVAKDPRLLGIVVNIGLVVFLRRCSNEGYSLRKNLSVE